MRTSRVHFQSGSYPSIFAQNMNKRADEAMDIVLSIASDRTVMDQLKSIGFDPDLLTNIDHDEAIYNLISFLESKSGHEQLKIGFSEMIKDVEKLKMYLWTISCPPYNL